MDNRESLFEIVTSKVEVKACSEKASDRRVVFCTEMASNTVFVVKSGMGTEVSDGSAEQRKQIIPGTETQKRAEARPFVSIGKNNLIQIRNHQRLKENNSI